MGDVRPPPPPPPRRIIPLLAAVAGVVVAHGLDYLVLFPQAGARADHLQATGHAYWPVAVGAAAATGALALMAVAALGARRGAGAVRTDLKMGWLLALQILAFVAMEAGERAVVGLPPTVLLHSAEFWLGLLLQVPVAWLARHVLGAVDAVADRFASHHRRRWAPRPAGLVRRPGIVVGPSSVAVASAGRPRAPPVPLACI